ncbi:OsmC family protein [Listeria cossartiae subsp. cayugensis]|uniref:OsmC family protein n=1 Tax=Listeria cossartiae TaxID=2838249 RepID=UPI00287FFA92|nr:OsmC family protein [Listeria cossartiae]MDT0001828.1 OsmC family protein [Listeria cossartiae subsp. cayugensis]MDT0010027.1 OsmC family protein [Listeria cossartiae subsp. cayugensis]MDT0031858.1 OsmC family protein [Listeria cossartiae subsp. cayugensis]MDT0039974.1 OsmC family protein [Listeria cossartiae subsp. cayugensis]MDT0045372.1 OsmC family protein [Listeria cossartiae subsp. cayugensis]
MTKPLKLVYTENGFDTGDFFIDEKMTNYSPADLMLMSIASCSAIVFRNILRKKRVEFSDLWIDATMERIPEEENRISAIHLHFKITGSELDPKALEKVLKLTPKYCSMVRSVENSIIVDESLEIMP